jgi:hypothetical protein
MLPSPLEFDDFVLVTVSIVTVSIRMHAPLLMPQKHVANRLQPDDDRAGALAKVTHQSVT